MHRKRKRRKQAGSKKEMEIKGKGNKPETIKTKKNYRKYKRQIKEHKINQGKCGRREVGQDLG